MKTKMKVAYVIRIGTLVDSKNVSNKLRCRKSVRKAIRAAKRMGFKQAYASSIEVSADCKLK